MSVENNVPDIRFKRFSGEWGKRLLGSLCLIGDIDHRMPESKTTGIPYLMTGDFYGINGLDFSRAKLISIEDYEQLSKKIKPEFGDILFARYASVGAVRYVETDSKFLISYSCAILKTNNTTYGKYLFYFFQTEKTQNQLELDINTGSQRNIGIDSLKSLLVVLPKPAEQTQIGSYFQKLDNLIHQHQQKHDKLSNIKKAMLEKMFPKQGETLPEIRFKGFSGEWECLTLSALGSVAMNRRIFKHETSATGEVPFFKIGTFGGQPDAFISKALFEEYKAKYPYPVKGDLLLSASGSIGRVVEYSGEEQYFQDSNIVWLKHEGKIDNSFLKVFYSIVKWSGLEGSTIKRLYNKNILDTEILLPEKDEQIAIGNYFQKLDALINQHQQQITKLGNIKQACLSKMFV